MVYASNIVNCMVVMNCYLISWNDESGFFWRWKTKPMIVMLLHNVQNLEFHLKLGNIIFFFYREYVDQRQYFGYCGIQLNHQHLLQSMLTRKSHLEISVYYNDTFFMKLIFTHLFHKSYFTNFFGVMKFFLLASSTSIRRKFTTNSLRG